MNDDPQSTDQAATDGAPDLMVLLERAREACAEHPELLEALDRLERIPDLEASRRPEELDAVHHLLRSTLADAGRRGGPDT